LREGDLIMKTGLNGTNKKEDVGEEKCF